MEIIFRIVLIYLLIGHYLVKCSSVCKAEAKCTITRAHKMKAADCYDRQFKSFPKCLDNDIEVIDLSYNRIRRISRSDLSQFKYLKFLYLSDNLIFKLDDDTFGDCEDLTTLDLSMNALTTLPSTIFQLPSLKTLYLSQNLNMNIVDMVPDEPVRSPLVQMDISYTTDESNEVEFPNFGILPFLVQLNITGNKYLTMAPKDFMGLCNLQILVNNNVTTEFDDACDCWKINHWLTEKKVKFTMFSCTVEKTKCLFSDFNEEDLAVHSQCITLHEEILRQNTIWKVSIGVGITIVILIIIVILYCVAYKKKCIGDKSSTKNQKVDALEYVGLKKQKSVPNEYQM